MRKRCYSLILFTIVNFGFAQMIEKPVYLFDVTGELISEELFNKKSLRYKSLNDRYLSIFFEKDSSYIGQLVKRKNYGNLSKDEFFKVNNSLNPNNKISKDFTLIQYHPGKDKCNGGLSYNINSSPKSIYSRGYIKRLIKKYNYDVYWVHKSDNDMEFKSRGIVKWQSDVGKIIENMFFKYHYPCNSFVIIDNSTRNYVSVFGESGSITVMEIAEEIKKSK